MHVGNLNLRQLTYFLAIADAGSITLAAAQLHVSQSAVAATLTQLEATLDVQLCVRRRAHGVQLTAAGRMLRDRASVDVRARSSAASRSAPPRRWRRRSCRRSSRRSRAITR